MACRSAALSPSVTPFRADARAACGCGGDAAATGAESDGHLGLGGGSRDASEAGPARDAADAVPARRERPEAGRPSPGTVHCEVLRFPVRPGGVPRTEAVPWSQVRGWLGVGGAAGEDCRTPRGVAGAGVGSAPTQALASVAPPATAKVAFDRWTPYSRDPSTAGRVPAAHVAGPPPRRRRVVSKGRERAAVRPGSRDRTGRVRAPESFAPSGSCPEAPFVTSEAPERGRSGVDGWAFRVRDLADDDVAREVVRHGTATQLLAEASYLGITAARHLEEVDAWLTNAWRGCYVYPDLAGGVTVIEDPETGSGWSCSPSSATEGMPSDTEWSVPTGDDGGPAVGCGSGGVFGELPEATSCPPRGDSEQAATSCNVPTDAPPLLRGPLTDAARTARDEHGVLLLPMLYGKNWRDTELAPGEPRYFEWTYVDQGGSEVADPRSARFLPRPADDWPAREDVLAGEYLRQLFQDDAWGAGGPLPFVLMGNELLQTLEPDRLGWLVLRTAMDLSACAPPDLVRAFPSCASPDNYLGSCAAYASSPPSAEKYLSDYERQVDAAFFHVVRAAFVVWERASSGDPRDSAVRARIRDVLGMEEGVSDFAAFNAWVEVVALFQDVSPFAAPEELDHEGSWDAALLRQWSRWFFTAPFDVLPFHWYNSKGYCVTADGPGEQEGKFLYLSKLGALVDAARDVLDRWWTDGDRVDLWCTETGISSSLSPYETTQVPDAYEYAMDPASVRTAWGLALGAANVPGSWPAWVFTSPFEQARQVWTRLTYMMAKGVDRVIWYTLEETAPRDQDGDLQKFYGYGLIEDGTASIGKAFAARDRKPAWCALRRWNQYLDFACAAKFVPGFEGETEGNEGFYAVVVRRHRASHRAGEYPFALVCWADGRTQSPWGLEQYDTRALSIVAVRGDRAPLEVATVPVASASRGCGPCGDDAGWDGEYEGEAWWEFPEDVEREPALGEVVRVEFGGIGSSPLLFLLGDSAVGEYDGREPEDGGSSGEVRLNEFLPRCGTSVATVATAQATSDPAWASGGKG